MAECVFRRKFSAWQLHRIVLAFTHMTRHSLPSCHVLLDVPATRELFPAVALHVADVPLVEPWRPTLREVHRRLPEICVPRQVCTMHWAGTLRCSRSRNRSEQQQSQLGGHIEVQSQSQ